MAFDPKCGELAEYFLEGDYNTSVNRDRLAQAIQSCIEEELKDIEYLEPGSEVE